MKLAKFRFCLTLFFKSKDFCAAFGTTGTSPLIHVVGITPEADKGMIANCVRKETIDADQLDATFKLLNQSNINDDEERIDWISLGNPHLSLSECNQLVEYLERIEPPRKKHNDVQVIACISRALHEQSKAVPILSKFGVSFVNDTCWCMLLHPPMIPNDPNAVILTNSGKYVRDYKILLLGIFRQRMTYHFSSMLVIGSLWTWSYWKKVSIGKHG